MSFANLQQARAKREAGSSFVSPTSESNGAPSDDENAQKAVVDQEPAASTSRPPITSDPTGTPASSSKGTLHAQLPSFLEIRTTPTSGRSIWAKSVDNGGIKCIPAGTRLFAIEPHAHTLSTLHLANLCSACHRTSGLLIEGEPQPLKRCAKCRVIYYCTQKCQTHDWAIHKLECPALQRWIIFSGNREGPTEGGAMIPGEAVRALARLLWTRERKGTQSVWAQEVDAMQSHRESLPPTSHQALTLLSHSLARYITASDQPSPEALSKFGINSARDLLDLISKFTVNSFTLTNPSLTSVGVAVSPLAALINHSCEPNAVVVFPRSSTVPQPGSDPLEVVAIKDIAAGEEILTSYVDISLPRHLRIKELQERYMFTCTCTACSRVEGGTVDPREAMKCERPGCSGLIPLPAPATKSGKKRVCSTCKQESIANLDDILDAIRLAEEALERASTLELEDPASAYRYTSNLIPLLSCHVPVTTHPLLALSRLHLSLLISKLACAVEDLGRSLADEGINSNSASVARLPKDQVDEVCSAAARSVAAVSAVFPEGHPVRGVAFAELGKLLCVDVDHDAQAIEHIISPAVAASDPTTVFTSVADAEVSSFPAGEERLKLARNVLLRARTELRRGFGGGGEIARQVEESIRNVEKEWKGWRKVVSQGGLEITE